MSHMVETMVSYGNETPWHQLGQVKLGHAKTAEEAMRDAGVNWRISKRPIYGVAKDGSQIEITSHFSVVRDTDNSVLGVVTEKYGLIQNKEAFAVFDPIVQEGRALYETAGALRGGRNVWCLVKLNGEFEPVKNDPVLRYCLATLAHDGKGSFRIRYTPIRVVCWNTLSEALGRGANEISVDDDNAEDMDEGSAIAVSVRHTMNAKTRVQEARRIMGLLSETEKKTEEIFRKMGKTTLDREKMTAFLEAVVPDNPKAADNKRTVRAREEIEEFIETGKGSDIKGVRGSLWGAYQGVTEWVDWGRGSISGPDTPTENKEARVTNMLMGVGARIKRRAMRVATVMAR